MGKGHAWQQVIQTVSGDFSKGREREPSISRAFVGLDVLDYKRAEQSDQRERERERERETERSSWDSIVLSQVGCSKFVTILRVKVITCEEIGSWKTSKCPTSCYSYSCISLNSGT